MTNQEKQKMNEKLARWRFPELTEGMQTKKGLKPFFIVCDNEEVNTEFTDSLDACFKWLVPKLYPYPLNSFDIHFKRCTSYPEHINQVNCWFYTKVMYEGWSLNNPALALCLAIEKLIDSEVKHE